MMKLKLFLQWNLPSIKMRWLWLESPPYHYRLSAWTEFRMTWWCKTCRRLFEISTSNITFWHKTGNYNVKYLRLVQDIGDVNISKMCKWQFLWYLAGELIRFIRHKNLLIFTAGHVSQDKYFPTWHIKHKSISRPSSSPCLQEGGWGREEEDEGCRYSQREPGGVWGGFLWRYLLIVSDTNYCHL